MQLLDSKPEIQEEEEEEKTLYPEKASMGLAESLISVASLSILIYKFNLPLSCSRMTSTSFPFSYKRIFMGTLQKFQNTLQSQYLFS